MIHIKQEAKRITIKGHANYSDSEDIVCAACSSIMYTTVNAIFRFNKTAINYNDDGNVVTIDINSNDETTETLITNMISLYLELASKYPKNIKIESEE